MNLRRNHPFYKPEWEERRIYPAASGARTTLPDKSDVPGGFMVAMRDSRIVEVSPEPAEWPSGPDTALDRGPHRPAKAACAPTPHPPHSKSFPRASLVLGPEASPFLEPVRRAAFSLIEILVVVALLSVIVLGLMAMFTHTQRAFRVGMTQTDVLESGRLVMDLLSRELAETTPANEPWLNFLTRMPHNNATYHRPFLQDLPGNNVWPKRTNLLHDVFFLTRHNQDLTGIGYFVRVNDPKTGALSVAPLGVGTLYRFEMTLNPVSSAASGPAVSNLLYHFSLAQGSEFRAARIVDGVNHFLVRAFDRNGSQIVSNQTWNIRAYWDEYLGRENLIAREVEVYEFYSNAVPAAVDLELGVLEDKAWQHYRSLPSNTSQSNYLAGLAGRVHLFRQRVPIRNVDPEAYQ